MKIKLPIGRKTLVIVWASPRFAGWYFERGPFVCWERHFGRLKIGWVLTR